MKLTLPQQDVYFEQLMFPEDPIYNIGAKIIIKGKIAYDIINKAYLELINQHDTYRSSMDLSSDEVTMHTIEKYVSELKFLDFSSSENPDKEANEFMQQQFEIPFELKADELLHKFILIKVDSEFHYLFSVYHHIITDGWGTSLMFQRLVKNYNELSEFGEIKTEYPFTYQDFIQDDKAYSESQSFEEDKLYWKTKFSHLPEKLFEKINQHDKTNQSKRKEIIISRSIYNELERTGKELGATTFHVILGILYLYFGRKHQNKDFAIGLPVLNRGKSVFKKTVGLFMGVSPLRMQFDLNDTFEDLVKNIKQQLRQDYRHQRFPLGKIVKELDLFYEKDRLFNMTLSYEKQNYSDHFINTQTTVIPLSNHSERVALAIYIREFDESEDIKIDFDYNVNYFDETEITKVAIHFENLLTTVIHTTKEKLSQYQYLTEAEEHQLLYDFNKTSFDYPENETVVSLFNNQVNKNPDKTALVDEKVNYTYRDLAQLSDKIAFCIKQKTRKSNTAVAVLMNRSAELTAVLLGVLKSGCAYIPLDPSFPKDRLEYIIKHSGVNQIIATQNLKENLNIDCEIIDADLLLKQEITEPIVLDEVSSSAGAYIIYTSGSTGNPKGVAISHKSLCNFLISIENQPKIDQNDYLFSVTTQSFDISILEFFTPLIAGAKLYIADQELLSDPAHTIQKIKDLKVTVIQATPSFFQMLYNAGWNGNKKVKVLCGGDLLSEALAQKLLETNHELWNMYGPTETTIWSSCKQVTHAKEASNIGQPINNTQFYILDDTMQLLPLHVPGTIYIGGDGLALGYYKNEDLTLEKFVQSPFDSSKRIYNTGDIGKWNNKGEIEFLGRNDNQVKIRGYRIELGEIETKLNQIEKVKDSVVIAQKNQEQGAVLIAFLMIEKELFDYSSVITALRDELPEYMIPHAVIPLNEFPLTPNKKIDRKALASFKITTEKTNAIHEKATTEIELALCKYYQEILEIKDELSITDNFFMLGGHSLNAVKLINKIEENLHYKITLKDIFDYPVIQAMSKYLEKKEKNKTSEIKALEQRQYYDITTAQYNIWLASQQFKKSVSYNMPAVFKITGQIDKAVLEKVFLELQKKYEILRTGFVEVDGKPSQVVSYEKNEIPVEEFFYDKKEIKKAIKIFINKEFDLNKAPLLRVGLFHKTDGSSYLVFCTHHIIMDGWSLEILINEFVSHYKKIEKNEIVDDSKLNFQFKDYAAWYNKVQQKNSEEKNLRFWKTYLDGYSWKNTLPYDHQFQKDNHKSIDYEFVHHNINVPEIKKFVQKHNISLHTLLTGTFSILMYKMYDKEDFSIGTVNSGRTNSELQNQLGMFVKTLPLRNKIDQEKSAADFLNETHQNLLLIDEHQDVPETISNTFRLDTLLVLQNPSFDYSTIKVNTNLQLHLTPVNTSYNRLPLLITFEVSKNKLSGKINYSTSKYEAETIQLISLKYEKLLEEILRNSSQSIESLDTELDFEKQETIQIGFNF
ncbi:amino acid adenylation domain-containing protein [Flavobacterium sp.]|uniref:amino acid adenylation domain-containing protein n=1 Tax=Flavobacterium sp. TaxID=239 RepID=UPI0031E072AB